MRILVVSLSPLKKEISSGNTILNLFNYMDGVELSNIYTRSGIPDAKVSKGFCITEKILVRNLLKKTPAGFAINVQDSALEDKTQETNKEKNIMSFMKSRRWSIFFWIQELVWGIGKWNSKELKDFIVENNPDIIFAPFVNWSFYNRLIIGVKKIANKPLVVYAWDNNYSLKRFMFSPFKWINHFINRRMMRKTANEASVMYVISDVQKQDYEKAFNRQCKVLTKGYDFSNEVPLPDTLNTPLKLVYTGNVGMNRWKSLSHIVNVLEKINSDGVKAQLDIYTGNEISKKMKLALDKAPSCFLKGSVSAEEVAKIQSEADILVHIESTDLKNRLLVRQSFSTKLVDYFHQAKCIVAFGPKDVASISHLVKNDAAVVADNEKELEEKLRKIIESHETICEYGKKAWECGKRNHQKNHIQKMLMKDFEDVISESCTD